MEEVLETDPGPDPVRPESPQRPTRARFAQSLEAVEPRRRRHGGQEWPAARLRYRRRRSLAMSRHIPSTDVVLDRTDSA